MRNPDVSHNEPFSLIIRVKGEDSPQGVQQNHDQTINGGNHEKALAFAIKAHRSGT